MKWSGGAGGRLEEALGDMFCEDSKVWNQSDQDQLVTELERWMETNSLSRLGAGGCSRWGPPGLSQQ